MIAGLTFLPALLNLLAGGVASKTTQRRQLAVGTGSGGTEVKPQVYGKIIENS